MTISNPEIKKFLNRVEVLLPILHKKKIINTPTRALFFTQVMGLSKEIYKNWYSSGIRETHKKHLALLEDKYLQ